MQQIIGWGIIGSSNGARYSSRGIDEQLQLGSQYDLGQNYGDLLPSPAQEDFENALYSLSLKKSHQGIVLGLAEYFSVYGSESDRPGTYLGAFVELLGHSFSSEVIPELANALRELSVTQLHHFVDIEQRRYSRSIEGVEFTSPISRLEHIAHQAQKLVGNYLPNVPQKDVLYVHCHNANEAVETLKCLLNNGLYYLYKQIFFSSKAHTYEKVKARKDIEVFTYAQLVASQYFSPLWRQEVQVQYKQYQNEVKLKQQITKENQELKSNQESIIETQVKQRAEVYIQQAEQANTKLAQMMPLSEAAKALMELGNTLVEQVVQRRDVLQRVELGQFASSSKQMAQLQKINVDLAEIKSRLHQPQSLNSSIQPIESDNSNSALTYVLAVLTAIFMAATIVLFFMGTFVDNTTPLNSKISQLEKDKIDLNNEKEKMQSDNKQTRKSLEDLKERITSVCEGKSVSKEQKSLCDKLK